MRSPRLFVTVTFALLGCARPASVPVARTGSAPEYEATGPRHDDGERAGADPISKCNASVAVAAQYRSAAKHRGPSSDAPTTTSIAGMMAWPALADDGRAKDASPTEREKRVFVLDAFVFLAKVEDNDCDIHLEVGEVDGGDRVIVEVPRGEGYYEARRAVLDKLGVASLSTSPHRPRAPVKMRFTGYAFYDGAHFSHADPQRGNHHGSKEVGTLWELHPVWRVELGGGAHWAGAHVDTPAPTTCPGGEPTTLALPVAGS